jgi:hypothetical protein
MILGITELEAVEIGDDRGEAQGEAHEARMDNPKTR